MRIAVIDLGTNTFNLLIAEIYPDNTYKSLYKNKIASRLGEGGITKGIIQPEAFRRGLEALKTHHEAILKYEAGEIYAFATSAIRGASNGDEFVRQALEQTGITIQTISGEREAELIYYGVRSAVCLGDEHSLIMDIGGGSTEFIIANASGIFWKHSFELGAARLLEFFEPSDPIQPKEVEELRAYLMEQLQPLFAAVAQYKVSELVGSSGSFDSLAEMIACRFHNPSILKGQTEYLFDLGESEEIYNQLLFSTRAERLKMKGLIEMRVDMIVVSAIFVHLILTRLDIGNMRLSTFSLKEGVLWELLHPALKKNS
jgi:exopolyphosphatase/guanosine-5'-triphosphate,3'-diphosphate pyrophosphatase